MGCPAAAAAFLPFLDRRELPACLCTSRRVCNSPPVTMPLYRRNSAMQAAQLGPAPGSAEELPRGEGARPARGTQAAVRRCTEAGVGLALLMAGVAGWLRAVGLGRGSGVAALGEGRWPRLAPVDCRLAPRGSGLSSTSSNSST